MASRGMPSLLALLGLAAVAGYQTRDKIVGAIKEAQSRRNAPGAEPGPLDNILAGFGDNFSGAANGGGNTLTSGWKRPLAKTILQSCHIRPGSRMTSSHGG